jgi:glycosyltransferase involved in cell wall biosynthesis
VGRLIELKGLLPFASTLADWAQGHPEQQVQFWLAGDGPLRKRLEEFHTPPNLEIRLLGNVAYDRLPEIYAQCGILTFPTLADEWGLVVVEAMASGLPVLGSLYSQAVEDLVKDNHSGWTFHSDQRFETEGALNRALTLSHDAINDMAAQAKVRVQQLTPSSMADRIMEAVEYACA